MNESNRNRLLLIVVMNVVFEDNANSAFHVLLLTRTAREFGRQSSPSGVVRAFTTERGVKKTQSYSRVA